jgi:hypothetical protein
MMRNGMSKLSASLFVLVMTLSTLGVVPTVGQAQTPTYKNIYIPVGSDGISVTDAWVNITNVHTGDVIAATYRSENSSYVVTNAPSGYYRIDVVHPNYYDIFGAQEFAFDGFMDRTVAPINLQSFPTKGTTWNVTVTDGGGDPIVGAVVGFYVETSLITGEFVAKALTDVSGNVVFKMFKTTSDVELVVLKQGKATHIEYVTIVSDGLRSIVLAPSMTVTGFAYDYSGRPATAVAYLINTDQDVPLIKRILKSPVGGWVSFDAYPGDFTLVVDAPGVLSYVAPVNVTGSMTLSIPNLALQIQRTEWINLTYGADFNAFTLTVSTKWSYDEPYPGLMYNDIGSLRAQIDLVLGNGNGTVDPAEVGLFLNLVQAYGSQYVSSHQLLDVNATVYETSTFSGFTEDLVAGPVTSTAGVNYGYTCEYVSHDSIDVLAPYYTANATVRYDSSSVDYNYTIALATNYELTDNSSSSRVVVSGFSVVNINPILVSAGGSETVSMQFDEYSRPIAIAGMDDTSAYVYAVKEDGVNVSRYIVAVNEYVNFTSAESEDPNDPLGLGNTLIFTWNFGDGSPVEVTRNKTIMHKYTAAVNLTANLTVTDPVGMMNWSEVVVTCDNLDPTPKISVQDKHVDATDNSIVLNMREAVYMNGTYNSTDDAIVVADRAGVIDHVQFEWGDGNSSIVVYAAADEQNMSHSYERAGTYTVVLNVTDVVGHYKNTTMLVKVNDTDAPTVSLLVRNATYGTTLVENNTLILDANGTHDNVDDKALLSFSWDFGDGTWYNATGHNATTGVNAWNVTHNYSRTGSITIRLNVTDLSNNSKVEARIITVNSGPRPKMNIDAITFDPETSFTEGSAGTITVNLTNTGSASATNIVVQFYMVRADGTQKLIGEETKVYLNGTLVDTVKVGETVQVKFSYSPSSKGTYTIRVNVTCDDQLRLSSKNAPTLTVEQAAWKQYALWGGVAAVIILIPLLLYLRGRWAKREKKGPRREKKEKEKGGSEEEL